MSLQPREYTGHQQIGGQKKFTFSTFKKKLQISQMSLKTKKNSESFGGWERRYLKCNSKCKESFTSQDLFSWLLFHISITSTF